MYATSVIFKCKTARLIEIFQLCQVRDQCSISMWSQRMIEPKTLGGWCYLLVIIIDVTPLSHVGKATLMIRCDLKATQDKLKHKRSPFLSESMLLFFLFNVSILFKESQNITKQKHMQFFLYHPARLQFVPAVLPRCHWHLLCSSHTTITATISRDLWIPQAGASISARILMLC